MYTNTDLFFEKQGMYQNGRERMAMLTSFFVSLIPLGFPWFAFDLSIDGISGFFILGNPLMKIAIGLFAISIFCRSEKMELVGFLTLLTIPMIYIYEFLTWHYKNITGAISLQISLDTAQFGFYLGMLTSSIMILYYIIQWKIVRRK